MLKGCQHEMAVFFEEPGIAPTCYHWTKARAYIMTSHGKPILSFHSWMLPAEEKTVGIHGDSARQ